MHRDPSNWAEPYLNNGREPLVQRHAISVGNALGNV